MHVQYRPKGGSTNHCFIHSERSLFIQGNKSRQLPLFPDFFLKKKIFLVLQHPAACDLIVTRVGGGDCGKGGNQIKIPLYYPAVVMPLAGIRARLGPSARCVLRGLPPVHKQTELLGQTGRNIKNGLSVLFWGTQEDRTVPFGPHPNWEARQADRSFEKVHSLTHTQQWSTSERRVGPVSHTENTSKVQGW